MPRVYQQTNQEISKQEHDGLPEPPVPRIDLILESSDCPSLLRSSLRQFVQLSHMETHPSSGGPLSHAHRRFQIARAYGPIEDITDFENFSRAELKSIPNFGIKKLGLLFRFLARHGVVLKGERPRCKKVLAINPDSLLD